MSAGDDKGCFLASGSKDQTVRIWSTAKGKGTKLQPRFDQHQSLRLHAENVFFAYSKKDSIHTKPFTQLMKQNVPLYSIQKPVDIKAKVKIFF